MLAGALLVSGASCRTVQPVAEPIQVVSVTGPIRPYNPGGPTIEIVIKNVSSTSVTQLNGQLAIEHPQSPSYPIRWDRFVVQPLQPDQTYTLDYTLIGPSAFANDVPFSLTLSGTLRDNRTFSYTVQVAIARPPT